MVHFRERAHLRESYILSTLHSFLGSCFHLLLHGPWFAYWVMFTCFLLQRNLKWSTCTGSCILHLTDGGGRLVDVLSFSSLAMLVFNFVEISVLYCIFVRIVCNLLLCYCLPYAFSCSVSVIKSALEFTVTKYFKLCKSISNNIILINKLIAYSSKSTLLISNEITANCSA